MARYVQRFSVVPKELFRTNYGPVIHLRDRAVKLTGSYDLQTEGGKVKPKALNPDTYRAPNGASMRPNTTTQQEFVKRMRVNDPYIYSIPPGTVLPDDLTLIHENRDHYSLQASKEMTLAELNNKITQFLVSAGECLTKEQWMRKYPRATEKIYSRVTAGTSSTR